MVAGTRSMAAKDLGDGRHAAPSLHPGPSPPWFAFLRPVLRLRMTELWTPTSGAQAHALSWVEIAEARARHAEAVERGRLRPRRAETGRCRGRALRGAACCRLLSACSPGQNADG